MSTSVPRSRPFISFSLDKMSVSRGSGFQILAQHHSVEYRHFTDQDRHFADGASISMMFLPGYCLISAIHQHFANMHLRFAAGSSMSHEGIMSVSPQSHQGQASMHTSNTQVRSGLERIEEYCVSLKEKQSIHAEAQFEVDSFKNAFPNIYDQIGMCD
ncbi:hypothetical protein HAX54_043465 [Datura stramonium]|uniref:Uncharacterized protein n=1 Tax=Datura stramonium TaxID=4076 RepID=A0ABS8SNK0_DATST|nr:hypothetical protein [Datura stramonium]